MVSLVEYGRTLSGSRGNELTFIKRRPTQAPLLKNVVASGIGYKTGTRPSQSFRTIGSLELWASKNKITNSNLLPPLVAAIDALCFLSNQTSEPSTLVYLLPGRAKYIQNSGEYIVTLTANLYLPHEEPLK
jgi:hypothetical protein